MMEGLTLCFSLILHVESADIMSECSLRVGPFLNDTLKRVGAAVRNLIFMPSYFQEKFLENIRKAKKRFDTI